MADSEWSQHGTRATSLWRRRISVWAAVAIGAGATLGTFHIVQTEHCQRLQAEFERRAHAIAAIVAGGLDDWADVSESVGALFAASREVEPEEFSSFASRVIRDNPSIEMLGWAPLVAGEERAEFEHYARRVSDPSFEISECGPAGQVQLAATHEHYVPVQYLSPGADKRAWLGLDLLCDPDGEGAVRAALRRSTVEGSALPIILQSPNSHGSATLLAPVYGYGKAPEFAKGTGDLSGFVLATFSVERLFAHLRAESQLDGLELCVLDQSGWRARRQVTLQPNGMADPERAAGNGTSIRAVSMTLPWRWAAGRGWRMECRPGPGYVAGSPAWPVWGMLAGGLLLTALLGAYLFMRVEQSTRVERLVAAQTAQLRETNEELRTEAVERERAEQLARESQSKYRALVEQIPAVIYTATLGCDGTITYLSPPVERLIGFAAVEQRACHDFWRKRTHPDDRERVRAAVAEAEATGAPLACEYRMIARDGRVVWVRDDAELVRGPAGSPICWQGVVVDITRRRHAEDRVEMLSRAVEQSPAAVVITSSNGDIEYVNPKFTELTGYTAEEVRGRNPRILKSGRMPPDIYLNLWQTITAGQEWRGELLNKRKDGELYWEKTLISPLLDGNGRIAHFVGVKENITAHKQTEDLLRQRTTALDVANLELRAQQEQIEAQRRELGELGRELHAAREAEQAADPRKR